MKTGTANSIHRIQAILALLISALFFFGSAHSDETTSADEKIPVYCFKAERDKHNKPVLKEACKIRSRLTAYRPNYAIIQGTRSKEDSFGYDQGAIEVRYSFRYLFNRPHCRQGYDIIYRISDDDARECVRNYHSRGEWFFSYTGEFDFYAGTRHSGPVINRVSNPAFHYRRHFADSGFDWISFSVEHRSNGQTTEIDETRGGRLRTQIAFEQEDREYFDGLSRGSNYYQVEAKYDLNDNAVLYASLKYYLSQDSDVNWGPDAADDPAFEDYDKFGLIYNQTFTVDQHDKDKQAEFSIEWLFGDEGLDTDSVDIDFMYPIGTGKFALPLYFRYHHGPMNTLSNYTLEEESFGIGIKLRPF